MPCRLVAIVGPTAAGKSTLALSLAARHGGEILNGDSRQIYRGMDIGTAKPRSEERSRLPHHLYDICDPAEVYSLARYQRDARAVAEEIWRRGNSPWLVGGTGQYVWSLLEGWTVPPVPPNVAFRRRLEELAARKGAATLHARLRAVDPIAAARIDVRNVRRVIRALEVFEATGRPISSLQARHEPGFARQIFGLQVEREQLHRRIEERTQAMFVGGLVDEVKGLLAGGTSPHSPAMSSIGYSEVCRYLSGEITLDEAKELTVRATKRLAKRQLQWFRPGDERICWVSSEAEIERLLEG